MPRRRIKDGPGQQNFLAARQAEKSERYATLRAVNDRFLALDAAAREKYGLTLRRWKNVSELLEKIVKLSDDGGESRKSRAELAEAIGCSRATVVRASGDAVRLGLLEIEPAYNHRGRDANVWRPRWDRLASAFLGAAQNGRGAAHFERGAAQNGRGATQIEPGIKGSSSFTSSFNSSTTPARAGSSAPGDVDDEWRVVVEEIFDLGVNQAMAAVTAARARGATASAIRDVARWWTAHRAGFEFPEVELVRRLKRWQADLAPHEGWPKFVENYRSPEVERERQEAVRDARYRQLAAKHQETIAAWSAARKRAIGRRVIEKHPELAHDSRAVFRKVLEALETRSMWELLEEVQA